MVFIYATVGQDDNIDTLTENTVNLDKQTVDSFFKACIFIIDDRNCLDLEALFLHALDL